ncbi:MAG: hypothetical protein GX542_02270 [Rhodococcus sp.]|nr:hypothetical protein [Rhodococcus sp. (in: high G+C Gram-positive bacteria)]
MEKPHNLRGVQNEMSEQWLQQAAEEKVRNSEYMPLEMARMLYKSHSELVKVLNKGIRPVESPDEPGISAEERVERLKIRKRQDEMNAAASEEGKPTISSQLVSLLNRMDQAHRELKARVKIAEEREGIVRDESAENNPEIIIDFNTKPGFPSSSS